MDESGDESVAEVPQMGTEVPNGNKNLKSKM